MGAIHTAIQDYLEAIDTAEHREIATRAHRVLELVEHIDQQEASWGLMGLLPLLIDPDCPYHAMTACLCEPLMRQGGDPWLVTGLIIERLRDTLLATARFRDEFHRRCAEAGVDPQQELRSHGEVWKKLAQEMGRQAYLAGSLELFCMPAIPIVAHFPQARELLRSDSAAMDAVFLLAGELEDVGELARQLEQDPGSGEPQIHAVQQSLARLGESLHDPQRERKTIAATLMELYRSLFSVDLATRDLALRGLADLITTADVPFLGDMGQLAGSVVETGGDPGIALDAILGRLPEVLGLARDFVAACQEAGPGEDVAQQLERYGPAMARQFPREAGAFQAAGPLCLGAIAMLSRSVEARKHVCGDPELLERSLAVGNWINPAGFLWKMLQVLDDEELLILYPEGERGWRVRIRGIADNFQLHTLLAGALVGPREEGLVPGVVGVIRNEQREDPVPGRPLDRRAVNLARTLPCTMRDVTVWSALQLWTWQALQADGTLPDNPMSSSDCLIWNEGVPAAIPQFGDWRVILIGHSSQVRSWNGGRVFHGMEGELTVEEMLDSDTVNEVLHRIAAAPR